MSIRFACKCGKHLRAGDTMAGRHTLCPKCGALVAIPTAEQAASGAATPRRQPTPPSDSREPTSNGADDAEEIGPILVRVRRRNDKDPNQFRKSVWIPLDPERGPPPEKIQRPPQSKARRRYEWKLESAWYQCLLYPRRAWKLLTALALIQSAWFVWAAVFIPRFSAGVQDTPLAELLVFVATAILLAVYTLGLFDCVLSSAGAGEYRLFRYPAFDFNAPGVALWLACFLAGPVIPAGIGIVYWMHCGDPDLVDRIILSELAAVALGYWLLQVLAAREAGNWFADPATVVQLFLRIGPRTLFVAAAVTALCYYYFRLLVFGMVRWHIDGLVGIGHMAYAQLTLLFGATALLRILGVWSFRSRPTMPEPSLMNSVGRSADAANDD
jgi:hypothetical protein